MNNNFFFKTTNIRELKINVIVTPDTETIYLKEIMELTEPDQLIQAIHLSNAFNKSLLVVPGTNMLKFDLELGKSIANDIEPIGKITHLADFILKQNHDMSVHKMVLNTTTELLKQLRIQITSNTILTEFSSVITNVFTNLNVQKNDAWIFYEESTGYKASYTYNLFFSIINPLKTEMICIPIGFDITAKSYHKRILFVTTNDEVEYSVHTQALRFQQPLINTSNTALNTLSKLI